MTTPNDPTMSHDSLDVVIAAYMTAIESGEVPNRQELLDRHPERATALRTFFADFDRMDRVVAPLRIADQLEATGAGEANGRTNMPAIRYFGDYELLEEIARGGMGIVYKARQVSLNRPVALKMILAGSFASNREIQRFRTEVEAAANLDHPHIVPIYEVGEHEGQQYYSMKFVEGTSLAKCERGQPRQEVESMMGVIRAVHHAHQRGVLHRDLNPSNVLVELQGTRLVADFGLAKRLTAGDGSFTETGQVLGTPKYMSPEQAAGRKDLTVAADVYSLGVILYERLTGQTPFDGDNALTLLRQARESEPPRPSTIRPGLDRDLETIVLKCLEKEPERRYASAEGWRTIWPAVVLIAALGREVNAARSADLAEGAVSMVSRLDRDEATNICSQAAHLLAAAIARVTIADALGSFASVLSKVSARLDPVERARICAKAARAPAAALDREKNDSARRSLASGLVSLGGLSDRDEVNSALVTALVRESDNRICNSLVSVAGRPDPAAAARINEQSASVLAAVLENEKNANERVNLAVGLESLAVMLDSPGATPMRAQVVRSLSVALIRDTTNGQLETRDSRRGPEVDRQGDGS
jgi:predicted Ser/Thr protein kinase